MSEPASPAGDEGGRPRRRAWNLLLLVPFLLLVTPLFNAREPELFGIPFFYWSQFAGVPVVVVCIATVFLMTRA